MASLPPAPGSPRVPWAWLAADLAAIVLFAASGRSTHEHGLTVTGIAGTAAPFAIACLGAWVVLRAWRSPLRIWPTAVGVWLATVVGGLLLRYLAGGGVAASFQVVTLAVLGILLLVPRLVAAVLARRRRVRSDDGEQAVR
jgi:hypothetical protein